ncbi:hypothetical protein QOT17_011902 [Balamuthia mandrillaris]
METRRMRRCLVSLLLFVLFAVSLCAGEVLWVDSTASCPCSGSVNSPYASVVEAVAAASEGDTINVLPGFYPETVNLTASLNITGTSGDASATVLQCIISAVYVEVNLEALTLRGCSESAIQSSYTYGIVLVLRNVVIEDAWRALSFPNGVFLTAIDVVIRNIYELPAVYLANYPFLTVESSFLVQNCSSPFTTQTSAGLSVILMEAGQLTFDGTTKFIGNRGGRVFVLYDVTWISTGDIIFEDNENILWMKGSAINHRSNGGTLPTLSFRRNGEREVPNTSKREETAQALIALETSILQCSGYVSFFGNTFLSPYMISLTQESNLELDYPIMLQDNNINSIISCQNSSLLSPDRCTSGPCSFCTSPNSPSIAWEVPALYNRVFERDAATGGETMKEWVVMDVGYHEITALLSSPAPAGFTVHPQVEMDSAANNLLHLNTTNLVFEGGSTTSTFAFTITPQEQAPGSNARISIFLLPSTLNGGEEEPTEGPPYFLAYPFQVNIIHTSKMYSSPNNNLRVTFPLNNPDHILWPSTPSSAGGGKSSGELSLNARFGRLEEVNGEEVAKSYRLSELLWDSSSSSDTQVSFVADLSLPRTHSTSPSFNDNNNATIGLNFTMMEEGSSLAFGAGRVLEFDEDSVKWSLWVEGWNWQNTSNVLRLEWSLQSQDGPFLSIEEENTEEEVGEEFLLRTNHTEARLRVVSVALADGEEHPSTTEIQEADGEDGGVIVVLTLPWFEEFLLFDPDMSLLVPSGDDEGEKEESKEEDDLWWKVTVPIVVVAVVVVALLVALGGYLHHKRRRTSNKKRVMSRLNSGEASTA